MIRIALNGFGRIGKNFLRILMSNPEALKEIQVIAINVGPGSPETVAYMFAYDTLMGRYPGTVEYNNNSLIIDGYSIKIIAQPDAQKLPWGALEIDWVIDVSGRFTQREDAQLHIKSGAKKVLISAPAHGDDISIIPGVNSADYKPDKHIIISLGSCTTNALLPILKVIHDNFGINHAIMTTTHAYTNSQALLDVNATLPDLRRSRAAALNIVPSTTGATTMVGRIIPELAEKVVGSALRVPVGTVSILELIFYADKKFSRELLDSVFTQAANTSMKNILAVSHEPLVSSDYCGDSHSVTIDMPLTLVTGNLGKVSGWYDNEWGYSSRLKDFLVSVA